MILIHIPGIRTKADTHDVHDDTYHNALHPQVKCDPRESSLVECSLA
jgi:hypothetical protein